MFAFTKIMMLQDPVTACRLVLQDPNACRVFLEYVEKYGSILSKYHIRFFVDAEEIKNSPPQQQLRVCKRLHRRMAYNPLFYWLIGEPSSAFHGVAFIYATRAVAALLCLGGGSATAQTCGDGTRFDSVLYVRDGSCTGSELACNDDTTGCELDLKSEGKDAARRLAARVMPFLLGGLRAPLPQFAETDTGIRPAQQEPPSKAA